MRAYQAKNYSKHVLGCSTAKRPTAKYIQGHKKDYSNVEEGQKEPILPIQRGGGYCANNIDCGYPTKGSCSSMKRCVCEDDFIGPMCLSHAGFDDNPPPVEDLEVDRVLLSPGFTAMLAFAVIAFISFVGLAVVKRRSQQVGRYDQLPSSNDSSRLDKDMIPSMQQQGAGGGSYQQTGAAFNPMGSNEQKTVTYCMIDGRLLDE